MIASLKSKPRWVCYRLLDGKKIPYEPRLPLVEARVNDESCFGTHDEAEALVRTGQVDGKGFVLGDGDAGVDLDDCRDPQTGQLTPEAEQIIRELNSYTEVSPSQTGVKVFVKAWVGRNHSRPGLEIYGHARYFTVTEQHVQRTPTDSESRGPEIETLVLREFPEERSSCKPVTRGPIGDGGRNNGLASLAGRLRRNGLDHDAILAALSKHNAAHCHPPLPDREVETIARSISRYKPAPDTFALTELGDALFLAETFGGLVRFDHRRGRYLVFRDHRWAPDQDGEMSRIAAESIRLRQEAALSVQNPDERKSRLKWAVQGESRRRMENALALARTVAPISDMGDQWDKDQWLLGVVNGLVDLRTGQLRSGTPADRVTMCAGSLYDPEALCPLWERTVAEIFNHDTDLIRYFQRAVGYSLSGDCREECLFLCWGDGRNGKGTLVNALGWLLGDYADNLSFSALELQDRGGTASNDVAKLVSIRYVTASESGESARFNESRIKALTGRDPITARFLYQEEFTFIPEAKFWLSTNRKPRVRDNSTGFWSRIHLIPFTQSFAGREDMQLKDKLRAEAPGILAWAVQGCLLWQDQGLNPPAVVREATKEYRQENEPLTPFFDACCVLLPDAKVQAGDLHTRYLAWCDVNRVKDWHRLNFATFCKEMKNRFTVDQKRHVFFVGIGLRHSGPASPEMF